jgi:hypothetical protein
MHVSFDLINVQITTGYGEVLREGTARRCTWLLGTVPSTSFFDETARRIVPMHTP